MAVVYNKPGKTGSTTILQVMRKWASATGRTVYSCSASMRANTVMMKECVPRDRSGCAVVAMHMELDEWTLRLLEDRVGRFMLLTSTRPPEERHISSIMQVLRITHEDAKDRMGDIRKALAQKTPWFVYNYHTGQAINRKCPASGADSKLMYQLVRRYDVVINVKYLKETNAILKWKGLFQIPEGFAKNVRGSGEIELDSETEAMLKNITCVENELYSIFQMRMAHLYGLATGTDCLRLGRHPKPCF